MKDMDSGSDGSEKSDKDSEEEEEEEDEDEESGGSIPYFDKKFCGTNVQIDKKNKRLIKYTGSGWSGSALGNKKNCAKWATKLVNGNNNYLMLGMAPNIIKINGNNYSNCGFYIYLPSSHKYSQKGDSHTVYSNGSIAQGTVYSIKFEKKKKEKLHTF